MKHVDEFPGLFDIQRPDGTSVVDAVNKRNPDGGSDPVVVLKLGDGSLKEMPAGEFLSTGVHAKRFGEFMSNKDNSDASGKAEVETSTFEPSIATSEKLRTQESDERLKTLFAPLKVSENTQSHPGYDFLFNDSQEGRKKYDDYTNEEEKIDAQKREVARYVTPEAKADSLVKIQNEINIDGNMRSILASHFDLNKTNLADIVDALRENPDVRLEVGTYLLDKVNRAVDKYYEIMPDRVVSNESKNPNSGLIPNSGIITIPGGIKSREWVALLCLAKLDGSFNSQLETRGPEYGQDGKAKIDQHRAAADIVLSMAA